MYPAEFVQPMRDELTALGFKQLSEVAQVEEAINAEGTTLVVVNSVLWLCCSECKTWSSYFISQ